MFTFNLTGFNPGPRIAHAVSLSQVVVDNQVIKDSNFYAPQDQLFLQRSALLVSDIGNGQVKWNTPYARRLYYNPQFNFSTDKNPNARGLWFEAAKSAHKDQWITIANDAVAQFLGGGN